MDFIKVKQDTEHFCVKSHFIKRRLRTEQISLSHTEFHTCTNQKKVKQLKDDLDSLNFKKGFL